MSARVTAINIGRGENSEVGEHHEICLPQWEVPPIPIETVRGSGSAAQYDPYLDAIRKFSPKTDGLVSKAFVGGMQSAFIVQTKTLISEAVDPVLD